MLVVTVHFAVVVVLCFTVPVVEGTVALACLGALVEALALAVLAPAVPANPDQFMTHASCASSRAAACRAAMLRTAMADH